MATQHKQKLGKKAQNGSSSQDTCTTHKQNWGDNCVDWKTEWRSSQKAAAAGGGRWSWGWEGVDFEEQEVAEGEGGGG